MEALLSPLPQGSPTAVVYFSNVSQKAFSDKVSTLSSLITEMKTHLLFHSLLVKRKSFGKPEYR